MAYRSEDFDRFLLAVAELPAGEFITWPKITDSHRKALRIVSTILKARFRVRPTDEGYRVFRVVPRRT